jgi:succinate dehydrogenase / fumarate reductase cytochrome b subunit
MNPDRPVNISLTSYLPVTAIASIMHRITGILLFVGTAYLIYLLAIALRSPAGFFNAKALLHTAGGKFLLWAVLSALGYHFIAGIKHLLLDCHVGYSLRGAQFGSRLTLVLAVITAIFTGVWLW